MATSVRAEPSGEGVHRLLRCRKTRRYFTGQGWTEDSAAALSFTGETEAVRACIQHDLTDIELVLRVPGASTDLFCTPVR